MNESYITDVFESIYSMIKKRFHWIIDSVIDHNIPADS